MSRMFADYTDQNVGDFGGPDPLTQLKRELDDMDLTSNLNFENPALMSSDFFDSVLSMEQSNFGCDMDTEPSSNVDSDFGFSEGFSDADDMRLNNNCSPDSGSSSIDFELKDFNGTDYKNDNDMVLNYINEVEETTVTTTPTVQQVPTKLYLSNPSGKKLIIKPCTGKNNRRNLTNTKQVLRVQSIAGTGGRSVLLPFNVAKMKNIKIINGKELQAENLKITKIADIPPARKPLVTSVRRTYIDNYEASSPETFDDDSDSVDARSDNNDGQYPILILTEEEKRLLNKEGINLPTHYPLTKQQERELKRIRRKIRNKISAQDSRKRKKEYVDGLEERIKQGAEEKKILMNRVKHLQQQNSRLIAQMNKLQALVFNTSGKATPTTCLLIVLMSALLVSLPNLRIPQNNTEWKEVQQQSTARRALLSSQQATNEDSVNMEEFLLFNDESEMKNIMFDEENNTEDFGVNKYIHSYDKYENTGQNHPGKDKSLDPHDIDDDVRRTFAKVKNFFQGEYNNLRIDCDSYGKLAPKYQSEKKFIEPDIDDDAPDISPPAKRIKLDHLDNCIPKSDPASNVVSATVAVNSSRKE